MFRSSVLLTLCGLLSLAVLTTESAEVSASHLRREVGSFFEQRDDRYVMRYETPNGIIHFETGYLRRLPDGKPYQVKEGYYIYPTANGGKVRLSYIADHLGFRVISYHISKNKDENLEVARPTMPTTSSMKPIAE